MGIKGDHSATKKGTNGHVNLDPKDVSAKEWGSNGSGGNATKDQRITSK